MRRITFVYFIAGTILLASNVGYSSIYWADTVYDYTGTPLPNFGGGIDMNGDGQQDPGDGDVIIPNGLSPIVAAGAPDPLSVSIPQDDYITMAFFAPFINEPGDDFCIVEIGDSGETADVYVSSNGIDFTLIGVASSGPHNVGSFGYYNWFDLGGFNQPVYYVKVKSNSTGGNWPGFDLSGIGFVPEPATVFLLGLGSLVLLRRKEV